MAAYRSNVSPCRLAASVAVGVAAASFSKKIGTPQSPVMPKRRNVRRLMRTKASICTVGIATRLVQRDPPAVAGRM